METLPVRWDGGTGARDRAGCSLAIADLLMQRGKSLESLGDTQTNQGIYYFSPCLYHPAKKSQKTLLVQTQEFYSQNSQCLLAADLFLL